MAVLKLIKGRSYARTGLSCKKGVPFNVDKELAKELLLSGRFLQLEEIAEIDGPGEDKAGEQTEDIASMKMEDLKKYAVENGIDIAGLKKKDEILDAIKSVENGEVSGTAEPDALMESLFEQ